MPDLNTSVQRTGSNIARIGLRHQTVKAYCHATQSEVLTGYDPGHFHNNDCGFSSKLYKELSTTLVG